MRIVFIGSKDMGCACLNELIKQGEEIVGVIARDDDPNPSMWYGSLSKIAEKNNLKLFKPKDVNDPSFCEEIKALNPDVVLCVFYPKILKKNFIDIPKHECINLHFAPLPKYRGCMPGVWAIMRGEEEFGVTMHYIDEGVDSGDIIVQKKIKIDSTDTGKTLYKKCEEAGLSLFKEGFPLIKENKVKRIPQDESKAIYHKRGLPNDRYIDWEKTAKEIYNFVRALNFPPFPGTRTILGQKEVLIKLVKIKDEDVNTNPGEILEILGDNKFIVSTKDKKIIIETESKIEVKKGERFEERHENTISKS